MTVELVTARPSHLAELRGRLRIADRLEIACTGASPARALWRSYRASIIRRTALVDGSVAAVWGCAGSPLGGIGTPWLLTAPEIERIPVRFVKEARREMASMLAIFPVLQNYVAADYAQACRFLECLGFALGEPVPVGPQRAMFRQFSMGQ